jgi:hypothetical protein
VQVLVYRLAQYGQGFPETEKVAFSDDIGWVGSWPYLQNIRLLELSKKKKKSLAYFALLSVTKVK